MGPELRKARIGGNWEIESRFLPVKQHFLAGWSSLLGVLGASAKETRRSRPCEAEDRFSRRLLGNLTQVRCTRWILADVTVDGILYFGVLFGEPGTCERG